MRLLAEGLVSPDADADCLRGWVHGERLEHLLVVIACATTRRKPHEVAPWLREERERTMREAIRAR